jgi:hypothetical protein
MADDVIQQIADAIKERGGDGRSQLEAAKLKVKVLALDKDNHKQLKKFMEDKNLPDLAKQLNLAEKDVRALRPSIKSSVAAFDELGEKIRDTANTVISLGKAFYKGEGTFSSYTDAFAGKFSILGDTISGTGRLLDTNIEMFRQLSQTGANFGQSIIQLRTAAAASALPLDDFANLVGQNSQALAALSGSTTQGAKFIASLGNALRTDAIPQLATLGFTVDEINETLMLDLDRQRRMGILDRGATQFNIDSAIRFGKQLDSLAKLTGVQRDELRKEIEAQQSNAKFAAFLQGQTKETADKLQGFSGVIGNIAPGLNEGFQDLIANAGRPVTDAAQQLIFNIPEAQSVIQDLINGSISTETALSKIRDASTKSVDRFRTATVTGQVEFLALQNDVINLGRRLVDVNAVLAETAPELADNITTGLTQFEDASKRMGSATQSLETAFLSAMGNFVGDAASGVNTGLTGLSKAILGLPPLIAAGLYGTGKILQGGIALLRDTGPTFAAVYAGVKAGMLGGGGLRSVAGGAKGFAKGAAGFMGRGLGVGAGLMGAGYFGNMAGKKEATGGDKLTGILGSAASGALIGSMIPVIGTAVGAALGGLYGGYNALKKRAFGGPLTGGAMSLVGEGGPELIRSDTASTVTSNTDLAKLFNTKVLETKMATMVSELTNANKTLTGVVNGVNTLVAVESRSLKAVEISARRDRNQVGLV